MYTSNPVSALSILYVEDNPANLRLIEAGLRNMPEFALITASAGDSGLEMARRYIPDIVLLDINLPGMSGYEVLAKLREDTSTQHIPAIAISADAMANEVERGIKAGFNHYLTKPICLKELIGLLKLEVEQKRRTAQKNSSHNA